MYVTAPALAPHSPCSLSMFDPGWAVGSPAQQQWWGWDPLEGSLKSVKVTPTPQAPASSPGWDTEPMINMLPQVFYRRPDELWSLDQKPASLCRSCYTQPGQTLQARLSVTGTPLRWLGWALLDGPWGREGELWR